MLAQNASTYAPGDSMGIRSNEGINKVPSRARPNQGVLVGIAALVGLIWFLGRR